MQTQNGLSALFMNTENRFAEKEHVPRTVPATKAGLSPLQQSRLKGKAATVNVAAEGAAQVRKIDSQPGFKRAADGALQSNFHALHSRKFLDSEGRADVYRREDAYKKHVENLQRLAAAEDAQGRHESATRIYLQYQAEDIEYDKFKIATLQKYERDPAALVNLAQQYSNQQRYLVGYQDDQDQQDVRLASPYAETARARIAARAEQKRQGQSLGQDLPQPAAANSLAKDIEPADYRSTLSAAAQVGYDADRVAFRARHGRDLSAGEQMLFDERHQGLATAALEKGNHRKVVAQAEKSHRGQAGDISNVVTPYVLKEAGQRVPAVALAGHLAQQSADGKSVTYAREADGVKVLVDRGSRIGIDPALKKDPAAMRAGVLLASQRFGQFEIHGTPERQRALAAIAVKLGVAGQIHTKDPELKAYIKKAQRQAVEQVKGPATQQVTAVAKADVAEVKPAAKASDMELASLIESAQEAQAAQQLGIETPVVSVSRGGLQAPIDIPAPSAYAVQSQALVLQR